MLLAAVASPILAHASLAARSALGSSAARNAVRTGSVSMNTGVPRPPGPSWTTVSTKTVSQAKREAAAATAVTMAAQPSLDDLTDPRQWLEEVEGEEALEWVLEKNKQALATIGEPASKPLYDRMLSILESKEKIPYIGRVLNGLYYNFWEDETHVRGIWRRCTLDE